MRMHGSTDQSRVSLECQGCTEARVLEILDELLQAPRLASAAETTEQSEVRGSDQRGLSLQRDGRPELSERAGVGRVRIREQPRLLHPGVAIPPEDVGRAGVRAEIVGEWSSHQDPVARHGDGDAEDL